MTTGLLVFAPLLATVSCSPKHHHQSSSSSTDNTPAPIVSTYTLATLVPVGRSTYDPFGGDSLSLNQGGLAPVTVTVTTLVPLYSTIIQTESITVGAGGSSPNFTAPGSSSTALSTSSGSASDGSGADASTGDDSGGGASGTDSSTDDSDSSDPSTVAVLTSWSTSIYRPQFASTSKKHHFW